MVQVKIGLSHDGAAPLAGRKTTVKFLLYSLPERASSAVSYNLTDCLLHSLTGIGEGHLSGCLKQNFE